MRAGGAARTYVGAIRAAKQKQVRLWKDYKPKADALVDQDFTGKVGVPFLLGSDAGHTVRSPS